MDGPSPANKSVLIGTNHTLTCRRGPDGATGFVLWEEDLDPLVTLFLNDERQAQLPKYVNFVLDPDNLYDLIITSIAVEDEGTYLCRNSVDSSSAQGVTRTVEGKIVTMCTFNLRFSRGTVRFGKVPFGMAMILSIVWPRMYNCVLFIGELII